MSESFQWQSALLQKPEIVHGSTDKSFGVLRYGRASDEEAVANREELRIKLGLADRRFVLSNQVHGNNVLVVDAASDEPFVQLGPGDALVTNVPGLVLVIKTADCVPVLLYDPVRQAVGAVHSGWRGTLANVVSETVTTMGREYGTKPADLLAVIGPAICGQHYDVSETSDGRIERFAGQFNNDPGIIIRKGGKTSLDLSAACAAQLLAAGVSQVEVSGLCTYEDDRWPSYRREGAKLRHDIWSYLMLK